MDSSQSRKFLKLFSNFSCRYRLYCTKSNKKYSDSVILPSTTLPLRCEGQKRVDQDAFIRKECNFDGLYEWQSQQSREKSFVLHDGPPYANGKPHTGHTVNKVLKDITNRYKLLRGYKIHYVPGWDCHGLPIELKALNDENNRVSKAAMSTQDVLQVRKKARAFAEKQSREQMAAFQRWGVMANWNDCYYTYNASYIARQFLLFHQLYEKGYIYRDIKPVFWSYSTRTALAEAELEYQDHTSSALFFRCKIKILPSVDHQEPAYAVIWTTTPWTIPCNQAICYAADKRYSFVKCEKFKGQLLIASETKNQLEQSFSTQFHVVKEIEGAALKGGSYTHPLSGVEMPFLPAKHVTMAKGSGLVHTAPAHGAEDFVVAMEHKLPMKCLVNEDAKFDEELGPELGGKFVLEEGNEAVVRLLGENALQLEPFVHKYPYDWRSKKPVILRASKQWFVDIASIKDVATKCLQDVKVYPDSAKALMLSHLENRPYWCISRQRVWGVPIPVFYNATTDEAVINRILIDHTVSLLHKHGADFWWQLPDDDLLPNDVKSQCGLCGTETYHRGKDILDIWFDSGCSWASVLPDEAGVADVFLEGKDQIGGWFQSTLLTSCALRNKAPYKSLYIHGFTVDKDGKKMSKSLGNVVDPAVITDGGKDFKKDPPYGADTLRWWVACHATEGANVRVVSSGLKMSAEEVQKVRNILRFLLGILFKFDPKLHAVPVGNLTVLDRYMLSLLSEFKTQVADAYDAFLYGRVVIMLLGFITKEVSGFYCHLIKDRLYCDESNDLKRLSSLTVAHHIFEVLVHAVAPILPFLAEEVYLQHPIYSKSKLSVFQTTWCENSNSWKDDSLARVVTNVRKVANILNLNKASLAINLQNFDLEIASTGEVYDHLQVLQPERISRSSALCELLQVAEITLTEGTQVEAPLNGHLLHGSVSQNETDFHDANESCSLALSPTKWMHCPRCRKCSSDERDCLCGRCAEVVRKLGAS